MKNILTSHQIQKLIRLPGNQILLAFDFDGTLAPIVRDPAKAGMKKSTQALFQEVTRKFRCAIISGRSHPSLLKFTKTYPLLFRVGDHGMDWGLRTQRDQKYFNQARRWKKLLERRLSDLKGVEVESKNYSVTVHYRRAKNPQAARTAIELCIPQVPDARIMYGKKNVEFLPDPGSDKGKALLKLVKLTGAKKVFYIGDDQTDEDIFALKKRLKLISVHVGIYQASKADYYLPRQSGVNQLLRSFLE